MGLAGILAGFSGAALAEGSGYYGVVDIGQTTVDVCTTPAAGLTLVSCSDTATAIRGTLGYQVSPGLGLEASYGDFGTVNANIIYLGIPMAVSASASGFQFSAVGLLPISDAFALTGKFGIAFLDAEASASASCAGCTASTSASNTNVAYGIGVRYNISKAVAVRAQYEDFGDIKTSSAGTGLKMTTLSFGVIFNF